jgi:hypothetical protein
MSNPGNENILIKQGDYNQIINDILKTTNKKRKDQSQDNKRSVKQKIGKFD